MGHGHVIPNADGSKARCGGPGICTECSAERARLLGKNDEHFGVQIETAISADLHENEINRRIEAIKSSLGILEQMKKIKGIPKTHEIFTLRSIARDALGIRGEES